MITIHFDGSCWPNPGGQAGYGAIIRRDGVEIKRISETIPPGDTSNNVAEYAALYAALWWVLRQSPNNYVSESVRCFGDSQLVIKQMWGWPPWRKWKIKKGLYESRARKTKDLLVRFAHITGTWVPREENSEADEISRPAEVMPSQPWKWSRVSMVYPTIKSFDREKEEYEAAIREMGLGVFSAGGYIHAFLFNSTVADRMTEDDLAAAKKRGMDLDEKFAAKKRESGVEHDPLPHH